MPKPKIERYIIKRNEILIELYVNNATFYNDFSLEHFYLLLFYKKLLKKKTHGYHSDRLGKSASHTAAWNQQCYIFSLWQEMSLSPMLTDLLILGECCVVPFTEKRKSILSTGFTYSVHHICSIIFLQPHVLW